MEWFLRIGVIAIVIVCIALFQPNIICPNCKKTQPKFRIPKNLKQTLWGGWICSNCGCEINRKGKQINKT